MNAPRERGWHPDPSGIHESRWFDGEHWTTAVKDRGQDARHDPRATNAAARDEPASPADGRGREERSPRRRRRVPVRLGVVVVAVLVAGVAAWALFVRDDGSGGGGAVELDYSPAEPDDYTVATAVPDESCRFDAGVGRMSGEITNDTDETRSYEVVVSFTDSTGEPLDERSTVVQDLPPGTSQEWQVTAPLDPVELRCDVTINNFPTSS